MLASGVKMFTLLPLKKAFMPASVVDKIENKFVPRSGTWSTVRTDTCPWLCTGKVAPPIPMTIQEPGVTVY
ncbi:hypothetical protein OUZ56_033902 [Daphnia magna]|uniref:Uncharacterized protein n=1 Tax=Daphnia magna TaxID=35525 RepID=A0ABR0BB95_9CRUS|nr:hypothetical protein OUZ56_033902 [Daphnia magna]